MAPCKALDRLAEGHNTLANMGFGEVSSCGWLADRSDDVKGCNGPMLMGQAYADLLSTRCANCYKDKASHCNSPPLS